MTTFLRAMLAGLLTAGAAGAQTPPPKTTGTPPKLVPVVAFKPVPPVEPEPLPVAKPRLAVKVFCVADLVCPPKGSPLAQPTDDPAMQAATTAYLTARVELLKKNVRAQVAADSWAEKGGHGSLEFFDLGQSLLVKNEPAVLARVGECLELMRTLQDAQILVEARFVTVPKDCPAVAKLLDGKEQAALTPAELKTLLEAIQADPCVSVMSQPRMTMLNKQTGFVSITEQHPVPKPMKKGQEAVELVQVGLTSRVTPDLSADLKSIRVKVSVENSSLSPTTVNLGNGVTTRPIDCQQVETTFVVPDCGSMAVRVGRRKVEQRVEHKLPVLGDLPYVNRLFRNVAVGTEVVDTIAVFTVTRVKSDEHLRKMTGEAVRPVPVTPTATLVPPVMMPTPVVAPPAALRVGKIELVGNTITQDRVILNQLEGIVPGRVLEYPRLEEARKNLSRLGIFDCDPVVEVLPPNDAKNPVLNIRVTVKETRTGMIGFGPGVNSNVGITGTLAVNERVMAVGDASITKKFKDGGVIELKAGGSMDDVHRLIEKHVGKEYLIEREEFAVPRRTDDKFDPSKPEGTRTVVYRKKTPDEAVIGRGGLGGLGVGRTPTAPTTRPVLVAPQPIRVTGPDGLERIGVDFEIVPPAPAPPEATMAAYRAACAAGKRDEAMRLAIQLLAKDPTCFGHGK